MATTWLCDRYNADECGYFGGRLLNYTVVRRVRVPFRCGALIPSFASANCIPIRSVRGSMLLWRRLRPRSQPIREGHKRISMKAAGDEVPGDTLWTYPLTSRHRLKQLR
jgi:hypothetical protein